MATVSAFKAQMLGGGARPNQFEVELIFPGVVGGGSAATTAARFLCRATSLPASILSTISVGYRGRPVHFAGERSFDPWQVSIFNDTDFLIRNAFETWHNRIVNYTATNGLTRPADYQTDLTVYQLDRNDRRIKSYKFYNAYPESVSAIGLSYETNNEIEEFSVTFQYNYFEPNNI